MNAYPIILSLFVFAMISIVSIHKNDVKQDNQLSETVDTHSIQLIKTKQHRESKKTTKEDWANIDFDAIHTGEIINWDLTSQQVLKVNQNQISESDLENESLDTETTFTFTEPVTVAINTIPSPSPSTAANTSNRQKNIKAALEKVGYWDTVHSIESKQGKLLYRPKNKSRSCTYTMGPCGHHQLTVRALRDIGCKSLQCRRDRLDYSKSLAMSKKLFAKNVSRLKKSGYENLEDYQKYLIHQQGANGVKVILAATQGKKLLNKTIKKNMANNSPYSYRQLQRMGSRLAARIFMNHWKHKWEKEKLLVAGVTLTSEDNSKPTLDVAKVESTNQPSVDSFSLPLFNESDIQLALNYKF